jgi:hypothetical protein
VRVEVEGREEQQQIVKKWWRFFDTMKDNSISDTRKKPWLEAYLHLKRSKRRKISKTGSVTALCVVSTMYFHRKYARLTPYRVGVPTHRNMS